jgi:two-component system chemotaxis response regulator CheY
MPVFFVKITGDRRGSMSKILIVDDAAFMRMALRRILERKGFEVVAEAENGDVGVRKYREFKPDLVTMDITMPVMNGIEALKKIISNDPGAKIIMVSALGQQDYIREAILAGAKYFIVKPFNEDHVISIINNVLNMQAVPAKK